MRWYLYVAYFFGGAFLTNAIPHFVSGVTGHAFQSPFASPPGAGAVGRLGKAGCTRRGDGRLVSGCSVQGSVRVGWVEWQ